MPPSPHNRLHRFPMQFHTALLIGRFQPVHNGHLALLRHALQVARHVIVVVGSAHQPRSPKNPFTWQERAAMLRASLSAPEQARVRILPVRDYYDLPRWVRAVRSGVEQLTGPLASDMRIGLVGHFKDASSSYLRSFPGWELISLERQGGMDATPIRDAYLGAPHAEVTTALAPFSQDMPPSTHAFLQEFSATADAATLRQEWQMLRGYRQAWATAPYPPVFVTVDALVRCQGQVLLIQRSHAPGKGLWALPGGFVEPRDTLWQSCLRELAEETHCSLHEDTLRTALQQVQVFDHPDRSQRGRTITHVHLFELGSMPLPTVQAGDDAAATRWVSVAELPGMEEQLFEDHFHILSQLLGLGV